MFVRRVRKKDPQTGKTYFYHQLVESFRTPKGPRQRTLLNVGQLDLGPKELKRLAKLIEDQMRGQCSLSQPRHIRELAVHFASLLRKKRLEAAQAEPEKQGDRWQTVDMDSFQSTDVRTVGAEAVGAWAYDKLQISKVLKECGFTQADIDRAKVLIVGKLIHPASERETHGWFHQRSALDEVMDIKAKDISLSSLYRTCDRLLSCKELWNLYNMLTRVETSFRSLKSELSLRPVYHRITRRIHGHLFVTVLAYHLLCVIQRTLHAAGIRHHWSTLRRHLNGQVRVTTHMTNDKGQIIHIRHTSEPEPTHVEIYSALGLAYRPPKRVQCID